MKILVIGAGQVGVQICRYLVHEKDCTITVLDNNAEHIGHITEKFNINGVVAEGNCRADLEQADIHNTNMIVVATPSDDRNVMIAYIAEKIVPDIFSIVRVRNQNYHKFIERSQGGFVNVIINPEGTVADTAQRLIQSRQLIYYQDLFDGQAHIIGIKLTASSNVLNTPLRQLSASFLGLKTHVVGFRRNGKLGLAGSDDNLVEGDEVYFVSAHDDLERTLEIFGVEKSPHLRVIVIGGGRVGMDFARMLQMRQYIPTIHIIEKNAARAETLAQNLIQSTVFQGDGMDSELLAEAGIQTAQTVVAFTQDDHTNMLALHQAKRLNPKITTVGLLKDISLTQLAYSMGIDIIVNPQTTTVSRVLFSVKPLPFQQVYIVGEDEGELSEIKIGKSFHFIGKRIKDLKLPMLVGGVFRDGQTIGFTPETTILENDRLILFMLAKDVKKITQFFSADGY